MKNKLEKIDDCRNKKGKTISSKALTNVRCSLNQIEESVFFKALSKIDFNKYPTDHEYKILVSEFNEDFGYNQNESIDCYIKDITKKLHGTYIEIQHDELGEIIEYIHIFGRVEYDAEKGYIAYVLDNDIIPCLKELAIGQGT